jgi:ATP adenylyltransferase
MWSPWRSEYIGRGGDDGDECFFCSHLAGDDDESNGVLWRGDEMFVVVNAYPYNSGHVMVAPKRHVGELGELDPGELHELIDVTKTAVAILDEGLNAQGFNVGMNLGGAAGAGVPGHLHMHVVPRWSGDTNFMPAIGETKVNP